MIKLNFKKDAKNCKNSIYCKLPKNKSKEKKSFTKNLKKKTKLDKYKKMIKPISQAGHKE